MKKKKHRHEWDPISVGTIISTGEKVYACLICGCLTEKDPREKRKKK